MTHGSRPQSARTASAAHGGAESWSTGNGRGRVIRPASAIHRRDRAPSVSWSADVATSVNTATRDDHASATPGAGSSKTGGLPILRDAAGDIADLRAHPRPPRADSSAKAGMHRERYRRTAPRELPVQAGDLMAGLVRGRTMAMGASAAGNDTPVSAPILRRPQSARATRSSEPRAHWVHGSGAAEAELAVGRPRDGVGSVGGWTAQSGSSRDSSSSRARPRSASPRGRDRGSVPPGNTLELGMRIGVVVEETTSLDT